MGDNLLAGDDKDKSSDRNSTPPYHNFSESQLALARSRTYRVLGRLALEGLTSDLLSIVEAIPELNKVLPEPFDADQAAADHHQLFRFNVFPYEGIFLDPSGLLGGPIAEGVLADYRLASFGEDLSSDAADHLGQELNFLGLLTDLEALAIKQGLPDDTQRFRERQRDFLDRHLLCWLLPLVTAVKQQGHAFYSNFLQLILDLIQTHRSDLAPEPTGGCSWPEPPALLTKENTSLKDIADYLLAPVYSGIYLSRDDIGRLANRRELPRGFGSRQQLLLNLWRSAVTYEQFKTILGDLQLLVDEWLVVYDQMGTESVLRPFVLSWRNRAEDTRGLFAEMTAQVTPYVEG